MNTKDLLRDLDRYDLDIDNSFLSSDAGIVKDNNGKYLLLADVEKIIDMLVEERMGLLQAVNTKVDPLGITWYPMETAPWNTEVILKGDSGYSIHKTFTVNGYRVPNWHGGRWNDVTGTELSDHGWEPTHWTSKVA